MIPVLNMNNIHRFTGAAQAFPGGGSAGHNVNNTSAGSAGARMMTGRQVSPRTSYLTSPRETSSLSSAHLTRRAADVAGMLEMNPLQCGNVPELQRKLVETAEWVVRLRHWYVHQLQERDLWYEGRLRGMEEAFHAAVAAGAAAAAATSATADAAKTHAAVESRAASQAGPSASPELVTPSTITATRNGASASTALHPGDEAEVDGDGGGGNAGGTPLRHRGRAHKSPSRAITSHGSNPPPVNPHDAPAPPRALQHGDGDRVVTLVGSRGAGTGGSTPLRAGHPRRAAALPVQPARRASSAGASRRAPPRQQPPQRGEDGGDVVRGAIRLAAVHRSVAATDPLADADEGEEASSAGLRHDGLSAAASSSTPLGGRPGSAQAPTAPTPAGAPGRLAATTGGVGTATSGRRKSDSHSGRKRFYATSPRVGAAGAPMGSMPPYALYLDAGTARSNGTAAAPGHGSGGGGVSAVPGGAENAPQRISDYVLSSNTGKASAGEHVPRRRSASSGAHRLSRVCAAGVAKNSGRAGLGASSRNHRGGGGGGSDSTSPHSSPHRAAHSSQ